jgi:hypothetical protein
MLNKCACTINRTLEILAVDLLFVSNSNHILNILKIIFFVSRESGFMTKGICL